jgi:hypothetical protein
VAQRAPTLEPLVLLSADDSTDGNGTDKDADIGSKEEAVHLFPAPIDISKHDAIVQTENLECELAAPAIDKEALYKDLELPAVCYDEARRIMTRTDFFDGLDHANVSNSTRIGTEGGSEVPLDVRCPCSCTFWNNVAVFYSFFPRFHLIFASDLFRWRISGGRRIVKGDEGIRVLCRIVSYSPRCFLTIGTDYFH